MTRMFQVEATAYTKALNQERGWCLKKWSQMLEYNVQRGMVDRDETGEEIGTRGRDFDLSWGVFT